jgi:hypothetical protein
MSQGVYLFINHNKHELLVEEGYSVQASGHYYIEGKACKINYYTKSAELGGCERVARIAMGVILGIPSCFTCCYFSEKITNFFFNTPWHNEIYLQAVVLDDGST